jgi:hypothetical protein
METARKDGGGKWMLDGRLEERVRAGGEGRVIKGSVRYDTVPGTGKPLGRDVLA